MQSALFIFNGLLYKIVNYLVTSLEYKCIISNIVYHSFSFSFFLYLLLTPFYYFSPLLVCILFIKSFHVNSSGWIHLQFYSLPFYSIKKI